MQYVNDDMDELFRRAAENYPLDTNSADWNKVLSALQGQNETKKIPEKKRNKNGRFLWLLLLLPLGFVCNQLYSPGSSNGNAISKSIQAKDNLSANTSSNQQQNKNTRLPDVTANSIGATKSVSTNSVALTETKNTSNSKMELNKDLSSSKSKGQKTAVAKTRANTKTTSSFDALNDPNKYSNDPLSEDALSYHSYVSEINYRRLHAGDPVTAVNKTLNPVIPDQTIKTNIASERRKKFYAGVMGGIDATTIKFQKIENAGFNFGAIFGYQFNKKWSIETGAYLERKYYYSDGKYFNTSKIYMPPNSRIDDVSGNCKMIEVPVSVRYNFVSHPKSNWFTTLGISSYFMTQENYTYNYYYGTTGPIPHTRQYKSSSTDLFSNISISGGYTHRLGNFADLRIEPYLKLPVSGMGIGDLPLFSTGFLVGVTKKF